MLSVHGVKIINSSNLAIITYVIELFPVEVNYLRRWFEHFGFGCYQAVKVYSWTLYLQVDLPKTFRVLRLKCDEENGPQNLAERSRYTFMVGWVWEDEKIWVEQG